MGQDEERPVTKDFFETVRQRFDADPQFRQTMLLEILASIDGGDVVSGKLMIKSLIPTNVVRHSIVIDQPDHPVAAPCAISYCQYFRLTGRKHEA